MTKNYCLTIISWYTIGEEAKEMDLKKSRDTFWVIDGLFKLLAIGSLAMGIYLAVQSLIYDHSAVSTTDRLVILGFFMTVT